jgi:RNA polymerase sigma-70 factor, ECF subfamily
MEDAVLLAASAAGDAGAFEQFMRRHQAAVARHLQTFTGSPDVDDAVQETFIAAWRGAGGFLGAAAGTGSARGWLYTIARHTVHHQLRRRVGEPAEVESIEELAAQAGWGNLPEVPAEQDERSLRELLQLALSRLPLEEREVLTLRELDGFSGDETAEILQISLAAMKSRLHRARIHLAAVVRQLERDESPTRAIPHTTLAGGAT